MSESSLEPSYGRVPTIDPANDLLELSKPLWGLKYADLEGFSFRARKGKGLTRKGKSRNHHPKKKKFFSWCLNEKDHKYIVEKLKNYETMTFNEIDSREHNHEIKVINLIPEARKRLKEIGLVERRGKPDCETLYQIAIGGEKRIWFYLGEKRWHILWWDPEHDICEETR